MEKWNMKKTEILQSTTARRSWLAAPVAALAVLAAWDPSLRAQSTNLNVANFGAVGDAVQLWVNATSNSTVITTTNQIPSTAVGDAIEVFCAGTPTGPTNNQDLIATITQVAEGTNITISLPACASLTNAFATYGHNNETNFANAIAACGASTNAVINIPAGKYLFLTTYYPSVIFGSAAIVLHAGGIHFVGAGSNNTTLLSQGAWTMQAGSAWRGFLFCINPPITNDYPVSIENLTLDGGVWQGNTSSHGFPASITNGMGWDETHDAIVIRGGNGTQRVFTQQTWTNVVFQHWRGEMVKSNEESTNGNLNIFNCIFNDGNATAINIYPSLNISNSVFENLFQVAEYYQAYSTNTCYFQNNYVTNITGNGFAINGGKGTNPPFIIQNNTLCFPSSGYNGVETTPGDNLFIISNHFYCQPHGTVVTMGCPGYQGTWCNSNIVIAGNIVENPYVFAAIAGGGSSTDPNRTDTVSIYNNVLTNASNAFTLFNSYGWATNVHVFSNDCSSIAMAITASSGANGSPFALVDLNNSYYTYVNSSSATTNYISYSKGSRYKINFNYVAGASYVLTATNSSQIPEGAQIMVQNATAQSATVPLYLNSLQAGGPFSLANGQSVTFQWQNGAWLPYVMPPTGLHVVGN